ncbi:hypothetical protein ACTFIU_006608 [Dictyostelium citrinum]
MKSFLIFRNNIIINKYNINKIINCNNTRFINNNNNNNNNNSNNNKLNCINNNNNNNNNNRYFCSKNPITPTTSTTIKTNLLKITKTMSETSKLLDNKKIELNEKYNNPQLIEKGILAGIPDIFDGIIVNDTTQYPKGEDSVNKFKEIIKKSLEFWTENKRRGIWVEIPESYSILIPTLVENGFSFHHCQSNYIMLTKWLPTANGEPNKLPHYTSHFIGCGGVVINDRNEILLITEKQRPDKWKIPGGANDPGEDICQTAVREVFEETGIRTEFVSILGFRQLHNYAFNRGDIYFVCALKPLTLEINSDPSEIAQCKWAPVKEFTEIETPFPLQKSVSRLAYDYCFNGYKGMKASAVANSLRAGNSFVYHSSETDFDDLKQKE